MKKVQFAHMYLEKYGVISSSSLFSFIMQKQKQKQKLSEINATIS